MNWRWIKYSTRIRYWIAAILCFPFLLCVELILAFIDTIRTLREAIEGCVWDDWIEKTKDLPQEEIDKVFSEV